MASDAAPHLRRYLLKAPKEEIYYISWTIDAYEGVAFVKNEGEPGVLSVFCSDSYACETEKIISAFEAEGVKIERINADFDYGGTY
ncbi:MAG: hypothetical protein LBU26_03215 [Synergistaceae bacterium]|jgi:hypothetical protein|nr:hypothetical protein [Synergistaceae bacterium]